MWYNPSGSQGVEGDYENDDPGFNPLPASQRNHSGMSGLFGLGRMGAPPLSQLQNKQSRLQNELSNLKSKIAKQKTTAALQRLQNQISSVQQAISDVAAQIAAAQTAAGQALINNGPGTGLTRGTAPLPPSTHTGGGDGNTIVDPGWGDSGGGAPAYTAQSCKSAGKFWHQKSCFNDPQTTAQKREQCRTNKGVWSRGGCSYPTGGGGGDGGGDNTGGDDGSGGDVIVNDNGGGTGGAGGGNNTGFGDDTQPYTVQPYDPSKCVTAKQKFNKALTNGRKGPRQWGQFQKQRVKLVSQVNALCPPAPSTNGQACTTPSGAAGIYNSVGTCVAGGGANSPCTVNDGSGRTGITDAGGNCIAAPCASGTYDASGNCLPGSSPYDPTANSYDPNSGIYDPSMYGQPSDPYASGMDVYESDISGGGLPLVPITPGPADTGGYLDPGSVQPQVVDEGSGYDGSIFGGGYSPPTPAPAPVAAAAPAVASAVPAEMSTTAPASDKGYSDDDFFGDITELSSADFSDAEGYADSESGNQRFDYGGDELTPEDLDEAFGLNPPLKKVKGKVLEAA